MGGKNGDYNGWTREDLVKEIEALRKQKTYGLVWEQDKIKEKFDYYINWDGIKTKETFTDANHKFPVLKSILSNDVVTNQAIESNVLIEGDNYHALAVLNFTHSESVDIIYIDPPYNSGTGDKFIYNNKIVDDEDSYRHSKWLSFMSKRLRLAKNLLKKDGVMFISINDAEQAQLKLLCDDVFNAENYVGMLIWKNKAGGGGKQNPNKPTEEVLKKEAFVVDHEYVLVYAKNIQFIQRFEEALTEDELKSYKNPDNDSRGVYKLKDLEQSIPTPIRTMYYPIKDPDGKEIRPKGGRYQWRFSESRAKEEFENKTIVWHKINCKKEKDQRGYYYRPMVKQFLNAFGKERTKIMRSVLYNMFYTQDGTREIRDIFGEDGGKAIFNYPKPTILIEYLLKNTAKKSPLILDFFAGSGTTGHAVLELNKQDGGNRKFILCTNNESNICTDVCLPRMKKAIKGYTNLKGSKINGLGGNLKYFKTDFVDSSPTDANKRKIVEKSTEMLCLKENSFSPVLEKDGFKIFKSPKTFMGIIFDEEKIGDFVKEVQKIPGKFNVYVFSFDDSVPESEFKSIKSRVKLRPIPEVILHVYRRIFKYDYS
ncbi:MAG: site-specific DNA-methyltransferase [Candidatus Diapherotrites archaeon]|nr:site-specific DNA-methyltransferase [Candidatus Diapherotrites archaeon]